MPARSYTLWTIPRQNGTAELIVNRQTHQWGTQYSAALDLGTTQLHAATVTAPVGEFTISIVPTGANGANRAILQMEWGTLRWTAPIVLANEAAR